MTNQKANDLACLVSWETQLDGVIRDTKLLIEQIPVLGLPGLNFNTKVDKLTTAHFLLKEMRASIKDQINLLIDT